MRNKFFTPSKQYILIGIVSGSLVSYIFQRNMSRSGPHSLDNKSTEMDFLTAAMTNYSKPITHEKIQLGIDFMQKLKAGQILAKVTLPSNRGFASTDPTEILLKQLSDYKFRPSIRQPRDKLQALEYRPYKYIHLRGEIIQLNPYNHLNMFASKSNTHTKKLSTTLVSPDLNTRLFMSDCYNVVAFCFDINKSVIKALFNRDMYSYSRSWVSTNYEIVCNYKAQVEGSTKSGSKISYRTLEEFQQHIGKSKFNWNEVLAALSKEGLSGILISQTINTRKEKIKSLKLAQMRKYLIHKTFNKDLPIVIYYPDESRIEPYKETDQRIDALMWYLQTIIKDVLDKRSGNRNQHWVSIGGIYDGWVTTEKAQSIIDLIENQKKQTPVEFEEFNKILTEKITEKTPSKRMFRS
ncbi:MAG: hypothetical protein H0W64_11510 [Gammaproteobacteria bacterium]|nr:hypothetical protein [Gammaproteobacteria bacterium]